MTSLCVNIDHIATVRQARLDDVPDPVEAASICEKAGAIGITAHLREDRRHIQDLDVARLRKAVKGKFNLEMAATEEMLGIAGRVRPDECTLVPEKRRELTTEGGLEVAGDRLRIAKAVKSLAKKGIVVSLFITPDDAQVRASAEVGASFVEFHTGAYAHAFKHGQGGAAKAAAKELARLEAASRLAQSLGLKVNLGHGLTYANVGTVCGLPGIHDLNIGHNIVARACIVGMERAVKEMLAAMKAKKAKKA